MTEEVKHGVAEIKVSGSSKLVGLVGGSPCILKKLESATAKKKNYGHRQNNENSNSRKLIFPNAQAKPFIPSNSNSDRTNNAQVSRPHIPPPTLQQNLAKPIDSTNAPVCYYHQTFRDKARTCRDPCTFALNC